MSVCIAYPNKNLPFSETFIRNHLILIPHSKELTGGRWPFLDENMKSIFSFPLKINLLRGLVKNVFPFLYQKLYSIALERFIKENEIDTLLCEYGPLGALMTEGCKRANVKLYVHFHGYDATTYDTIKEYKNRYIAMGEYASRIIVVSNDMKDELSQLGLKKDKVFVIPCGIDLTRFTYSTDLARYSSKRIIYVGRFTEKKSPLLTITSFKLVLDKVPDAKLIMIGDGELLNQSKKLVKDLELTSSVVFEGILDSNAVSEALSRAAIFVLHSVKAPSGDCEGTPNSLLEASACGLPIVSTFHAGIKEAVVHEKSGFLVDENDGVQMATYLVELLNNPSLCATMGLYGHDHIKNNYNLTGQCLKLATLIKR